MLHQANDFIECVMNVSEGRDIDCIQSISAQVESVPGSYLLDCSSDPDHHRTVLSFIGGYDSILDSAYATIRRAIELIDMRTHRGVHPRIGAVDVVPFVPLGSFSMESCIELARSLGDRVAGRLGIPVYLYEDAALRPDRTQLPDIRRGGLEGLAKTIATDPYRTPDFGPALLHPTAGAIIIGARVPLIAFNIYLGTGDVELARRIARSIRERDGGMQKVRAMGFFIARKQRAQVSINLRDYRQTSILAVWERVRREAEDLGVSVVSSEIIGLAPSAALNDSACKRLGLETSGGSPILERRIAEVLASRGSREEERPQRP